MDEMVYLKERRMKILAEGIYKGRKYCILSLGIYPTAYVEYRHEFDEESEEYFNIPCHCGITFQDYAHWKKDYSTCYIGWDYGHIGDFVDAGLISQQDGKKWTTEEVYEEVKNVIDYLNKYEQKSPASRLDDFVYEALNCGDDEVDIKECYSYKSLVRDLEVLSILKKQLQFNLVKERVTFVLPKKEREKVEEWLEKEDEQ